MAPIFDAPTFTGSVSAEEGAEFAPEAGRYRLYVSMGCPKAHRAMIVHALKGLGAAIPLCMLDGDLAFSGGSPAEKQDDTGEGEPHGFSNLGQLYELCAPGCTAGEQQPSFLLPVLFDERTQKIVSNDSQSIAVMLNSQFNEFSSDPDLNLMPTNLFQAMAGALYMVLGKVAESAETVGWSDSQSRYDDALRDHLDAVRLLEERLSSQQWLCGDRLTYPDVCLFPTLLRYDAVYAGHYKLARRLVEMPHLLAYTRRFLQLPGVRDTCDLNAIVQHFYAGQRSINPSGVVPRGLKAPVGLGDILTNDWGLSLEVDSDGDAESKAGAFVRRPSRFTAVVSPEAGAEFPAEAGRYRLYVSLACPWAHRTLMVRALKGITDEMLPVTTLSWTLENLSFEQSQEAFDKYRGWSFDDNLSVEPHDFKYLDELYEHADPGYRASFAGTRPVYSVPVLFDEKTQKIVNNESADICLMLNSAFNGICNNPELDLVPAELQDDMASVNKWIYSGINNGVYKCGFASTQDAYDAAALEHWQAMERAEALLSEREYLCGDRLTLADIRLFPTMIRYDAVYYYHFKTARRMLAEMPALLRHTRSILQLPGITETTSLEHIIRHYYQCQVMINPLGIVPRGPRRAPGLGDLLENTWGFDADLTAAGASTSGLANGTANGTVNGHAKH